MRLGELSPIITSLAWRRSQRVSHEFTCDGGRLSVTTDNNATAGSRRCFQRAPCREAGGSLQIHLISRGVRGQTTVDSRLVGTSSPKIEHIRVKDKHFDGSRAMSQSGTSKFRNIWILLEHQRQHSLLSAAQALKRHRH